MDKVKRDVNYEGEEIQDKRLFDFEDEGDYVQLESNVHEYPHPEAETIRKPNYEGEIVEDKRWFDFEEPNDF